MTIDEEINRFFLEYKLREKILPYNTLPEYLQKLQHYVLLTHGDLDGDMLVRILSQIRYEAGDYLNNKTWDKINLLIQSSLEQIPYMSKLNLIESYGDIPELLKKALEKLNFYRNKFAHPKIDLLLSDYNIKSHKGKVNIRDLIRALKRASDLFLQYAESSVVCNYYIKRQLEKEKSPIMEQSQNRTCKK
ncbi:MAG: hypothetical protein WC625_07565 [Caldisericia bacterium]